MATARDLSFSLGFAGTKIQLRCPAGRFPPASSGTLLESRPYNRGRERRGDPRNDCNRSTRTSSLSQWREDRTARRKTR